MRENIVSADLTHFSCYIYIIKSGGPERRNIYIQHAKCFFMRKLTIVITSAAVAFLLMPAAHAAVFAEVASASYCPDGSVQRCYAGLCNRGELSLG